MRLGGLIFKKWSTPEEWAKAALDAGYTAVYFPVDYTAPQSIIDGYVEAAKAFDLRIAEVGAWSNVLDPDTAVAEKAIERCIHQLELADYVNANCCVNIAGSFNPKCWDGHHPDNMTQKGFDAIVSVAQKIIDAAKPVRSFYALEPMPWMYPDTPKSCLDLIKAVDRKQFGAHIDIVNIICSPWLYYHNAEVIREWFDTLAPYIRSIHAKDTVMGDELTVHLSECRPGTGYLDYKTYLSCASKLNDDVTVMLEHMTEESDYIEATKFLKQTASELGLHF